MAVKPHKLFITVILLLNFFVCLNALPVNTTIKGVVKDSTSGDALSGANVILVGTNLGTATDMNGFYQIKNIPIGTHTLRVTYIGYEKKEEVVEITSGKTIEINFNLRPDIIEGKEVVISAQREGQTEAINKQINSDAIKNIVSADKIEELPEANAAEAVGRLPGVSLLREGGEGNKVVIRGLAPKYNKVQIDGVDMSATDPENRSADLSMISPYMLGGIEVSKTAMADQEADQLGGIVNFITKGAPYTEPQYKIIAEGGYNGLRNIYEDFRIAAQTNRREFDNKLGLSLNVDYEKRNRSSNTVSSDYYYLNEDKMAVVNSLNIQDITRELERFGASFVMDYKTSSTNIIFSNMLSRINRTTINRSENTVGLFGSSSTSRNQNLSRGESNTWILMNQLKAEQNIGDIKIEAGVTYSLSENNNPEILSYGGVEQTPLARPVSKTARPDQIPNFMKNEIADIKLGTFSDSDEKTKEEEIASFLNLEWEYRISDLINFKLKTGGKYKHKFREHDFNTIYLNIFQDPSSIVNDALIAKYPWMAEFHTSGKFPYEPFIDYNYDPGDFMQGEYSLERIPQLGLGVEAIHYLEDYLGIEWGGATQPTRFTPNFHTSRMYDYNGTENYWAWYLLPTISIGDKLTFIPGVRYEYNETNYNGVRGNANLQISVSKGYVHYDTTVTRTNKFFLPMIHAKYKPFDWFDIRASYTQTLSRPSYIEFLPSWHIDMFSIDYKNPNLKPAKSQNFDLYFSLYGNKIGLFTFGLFAKEIDDLIFPQSKIIVSDTMAVEEYGLSEEFTGQDPGRFKGKSIWSYINNPNRVHVRGLEVEWQSNLWYLPGLLSNIVFSINYTYTFSEVKYPRTVPVKEFVESPFGRREVIVDNVDSAYTAPLLYQPDHILNITLGYDFMGFSIRGSVQFKSQIFSQNNWRPQLRGFTDAFTIFDLAVSQKLPIDGLEIYGNLKNITKTMESDYNNGTGYMSNKEYYGMSGNLGIKYQF